MLELCTGACVCVPIKVVRHICLEGYMAGPVFKTASNKPNKEIRYMIARRSYVFSMERENTEQRKEDWSAEGLRVVLLSRIRRGCLSELLEVNKPCGVVKEACCGQREESREAPSMRRPVVMEMASMAVVEGGKGRSGHWGARRRGLLPGVRWEPLQVWTGLGVCDCPLVSCLLWFHCS